MLTLPLSRRPSEPSPVLSCLRGGGKNGKFINTQGLRTTKQTKLRPVAFAAHDFCYEDVGHMTDFRAEILSKDNIREENVSINPRTYDFYWNFLDRGEALIVIHPQPLPSAPPPPSSRICQLLLFSCSHTAGLDISEIVAAPSSGVSSLSWLKNSYNFHD